MILFKQDLVSSMFLASDFGLPIDDIQLVIGAYDCGGSLCHKRYTDIIRGMHQNTLILAGWSSKHMPVYLYKTQLYENDEYAAARNLSNLVTTQHDTEGIFFKNIVTGVGSYHLYMSRPKHMFRSTIWNNLKKVFVARYFQACCGISEYPVPKEQRIGILVKRGKRSLSNYDQLIPWIESLGVPVSLIEPPQTTWQAELETVASSTVTFMVSGGASFSTGFLDSRSVGILIDIWDFPGNCSTQYESNWWETLGAFQGMNYILDYSEVLPPASIIDNTTLTDAECDALSLDKGTHSSTLSSNQVAFSHVHLSSFKLEERKVKDIICRALGEAEKNYGWVDTFDRSKCEK
jgi:hypothetical protein